MFHRDIKPGNFLFTCKTNKGYLIDFNLAKVSLQFLHVTATGFLPCKIRIWLTVFLFFAGFESEKCEYW